MLHGYTREIYLLDLFNCKFLDRNICVAGLYMPRILTYIIFLCLFPPIFPQLCRVIEPKQALDPCELCQLYRNMPIIFFPESAPLR